jgi:hypothetical protein
MGNVLSKRVLGAHSQTCTRPEPTSSARQSAQCILDISGAGFGVIARGGLPTMVTIGTEMTAATRDAD